MKKINLITLVLVFVFAAGLAAPSAMANTKQGRKHHKKSASHTDTDTKKA